ncbi:hypothetical protein NPIL_56871 [Nephila pilipes]|uniref:Uncharacterized protein n=1 Tax=Nephila pilipes TaxID=299642 RepID=A0A8X6MY83_NEPPI|nr:hypothetical protein NPIL_56871 [Nephila pilipes]
MVPLPPINHKRQQTNTDVTRDNYLLHIGQNTYQITNRWQSRGYNNDQILPAFVQTTQRGGLVFPPNNGHFVRGRVLQNSSNGVSTLMSTSDVLQ